MDDIPLSQELNRLRNPAPQKTPEKPDYYNFGAKVAAIYRFYRWPTDAWGHSDVATKVIEAARAHGIPLSPREEKQP